jgi:hypothetical protein
LLNVLSKIGGLRVASHTSAFSFKGGKSEIATLAQKLNVATILEGSVRKAGKRVRRPALAAISEENGTRRSSLAEFDRVCTTRRPSHGAMRLQALRSAYR